MQPRRLPTLPKDRRALALARARRRPAAWLVLLLAAGLHGCDGRPGYGATANPVAPGRPGTGNPVVHVSPRPGSINESPGIGGSRGLIPPGASGGPTLSAVPGAGSRDQPGVGLDGGLGPVPAQAADAQGAASGPHGTRG